MEKDRFLVFQRDAGDKEHKRLETAVTYDTALQIDEKNDWRELGEMNKEQIEELVQVATRGINELIHFCFVGKKLDPEGKAMREAFRKFIAISWALKSHLLVGRDGKVLSLRELSEMPQVSCSKYWLSLLASEFCDKWGFHVRVQKRPSAKENYSKAAKGGWIKRRQRQADEAMLSVVRDEEEEERVAA